MGNGLRDSLQHTRQDLFGEFDALTDLVNFRNKSRKRKTKKRRNVARKTHRKTSKRVGRIKYTKNGQPYIILKSGKARFIKGRRR